MLAVITDLIATWIEFIACFLLSDTFLQRKQNGKSASYFGLTAVGGAIVDQLCQQITVYAEWKVGIFVVLITLIQYAYYHKNLWRICLLSTVGLLFTALIDYFVICAMSFYMDIQVQFFLQMTTRRVAATVLSKTILIGLVVFLKCKFKEHQVISMKYYWYLLIVTVMDFFCGMYLFRVFMERNAVYATEMVVFALLLPIEILVMWTILSFSESAERYKQVHDLELHNVMLKQMQEKEKSNLELWSRQIHDYKNHLLYMQELLREKQYDRLKEYMEEETGIIWQAAPIVATGYIGIDSIVNAKNWYAMSKKIHLTTNIHLPDDLVLDDQILANILGNLLDNAIDAEEHELTAVVELQIGCNEQYVFIRIINPVSRPTEFEHEKVEEEDYYHGIGLKSVQKSVDAAKGEFYIRHEQGQVKALVVLPKITK